MRLLSAPADSLTPTPHIIITLGRTKQDVDCSKNSTKKKKKVFCSKKAPCTLEAALLTRTETLHQKCQQLSQRAPPLHQTLLLGEFRPVLVELNPLVAPLTPSLLVFDGCLWLRMFPPFPLDTLSRSAHNSRPAETLSLQRTFCTSRVQNCDIQYYFLKLVSMDPPSRQDRSSCFFFCF